MGYGGTKSEMERLIKDAEGLDESFKASRDSNGELTMSYGDIVQAIHIVQDEMGITGTTAKEANETISGSLRSLEAAWQNTLIAFGTGDENEIERTMGALVDSAVTFVDNLTPIIENALTAIGQFILAIAPIIKEKLPPLIRKTLPTLLNALKELVTGLITALPSILAAVWESVHDLLNQESENIAKILKDMFGIDIDAEQITAALEAVLGGILTYNAVAGVIGLINGLTAAFETFKAVGLAGLLGNPVALAIGAVTAAVLYLWETSDDFRNIVSSIWEDIKGYIEDPMSFVNDLIQFGVDKVQAFWDKCVELGDAIGGIWEDIKTATVEKWNAIIKPIKDAIEAVKEFLGLDTTNTDNGKNRYAQGLQYSGGTPYVQRDSGGEGGGRIKHASAMRNGEILRGITPFGFDQAGNVHYGGEAGAEAVVGVSSLRQMVQEAAMNAVRHINVQLILDNGVLVAEMAPLMDEQLNDLATWRGGGRA